MVNCTFTADTPDDIDQVSSILKDDFNYQEHELDKDQKQVFNITVYGSGNSLKIIGFESQTILLQGGGSEKFAEKVKSKIRQCDVREKEKTKSSQSLADIEKKYFLGFDESGRGECIGPLILGGALIEKDALATWDDRLEGKKVKDMSFENLNYWMEKIEESNSIKTYLEEVSALEIVKRNLNLNKLVDKGYLETLKKNSEKIGSSCVIIDDYGVGDSLRQETQKWGQRRSKVIIESRADEKYIPVRIASIAARFERKRRVYEIIGNNQLEYDGKTLRLEDGSAHPKTEEWLRAFRKKNPTRRFPFFVRTSWSNVEKIEEEFPREVPELESDCSECEATNSLIYGVKHSSYTELFCSRCGSKLDTDVLQNLIFLFPDTSILVGRIISTDLGSNKPYFEGKKILLSKQIQQEIDSLGRKLKKGANNEITALEDYSSEGKIGITRTGTTLRGQDFLEEGRRDREIFVEALKEDNAMLVTKDNSLGTTSIDCFRLLFLNPNKWENEKEELITGH